MSTYTASNDSEENNPEYIFSLTSNELLGAIVRGELNPVDLAKMTLANRGYDKNGNWVGFKK